MRKKVFFRADGNSRIGYGHVNRLLALGLYLHESFEVCFIVKDSDEGLLKQISNYGFKLILLPKNLPLNNEAEALATNFEVSSKLIIFDGYDFGKSYQDSFISKGNTIVFIDDFLKTYQHVHGIINHTPGVSEIDYSNHPPMFLAVGSSFTLVKPSFTNITRLKNFSPKLFICLGGADFYNLTVKVLNATIAIDANIERVVVIGGAYKNQKELNEWIQDNSQIKVTVYSNIGDVLLSKLIAESTIAITSASNIALEVCVVGVPLLCGSYINNQDRLLVGLKRINCVVSLGDLKSIPQREILNEVKQVLKSHDQRSSLEKACNHYFTGEYEKKIRHYVNEMYNISRVQIRAVEKSDEELLLHWANDDDVRKNAVSTKKIGTAEHNQWFSKKLLDSNTFIFIFSINEEPIGLVRFDGSKKGYEIDYLIDKKFRGRGLGKIILFKSEILLSTHVDKPKFIGMVATNNLPSSQVFKSLCYKNVGVTVKNRKEFQLYEKQLH